METKQSSEGFWGPEKTTIESASNKVCARNVASRIVYFRVFRRMALVRSFASKDCRQKFLLDGVFGFHIQHFPESSKGTNSFQFPRSSVVMHKKGGDLRPEEAYGIQALWGTVFYFEPKHQVSSDTSLHFSSNATDYVVAEWNKDRWTDDEFFFITGDVNGVKVLAAARLRAVDLSFNGRVFRIYGMRQRCFLNPANAAFQG